MYINEFVYDWIFTIYEMELRQDLENPARKAGFRKSRTQSRI